MRLPYGAVAIVLATIPAFAAPSEDKVWRYGAMVAYVQRCTPTTGGIDRVIAVLNLARQDGFTRDDEGPIHEKAKEIRNGLLKNAYPGSEVCKAFGTYR
ncbi:hypothetical protein [Xanthobacter autotrophicus]|uniref:hypothetical protein n=1 Tax=Xanthobacter autotrophicus TaxID=280 RepID=UPI0024A726FD|nr:hypothetical protein [Xanthobacter autotrophicus]MDI4656566.1 hypothetical protein [Xanthobacter autotrophicus]